MNPEEVNSVPPVESVQESVVYQEPLEEGKKKKTNIILLVVIIFLFLGLSAFGYLFWSRLNIDSESDSTDDVQVEDVTPQGQPETEVEDAETPQGEYEIVLLENIKDSSDTDVYIKNVETGEEDFLRTIRDVYRNRVHPAEYHDGILYIIRRIGYDGYPDEDWTDELWKYDEGEEGTKIYSAKGLGFRVSPNGEMIAIRATEDILFVDADGNVLKEYPSEELIPADAEELSFDLLDWSDDSKSLWGDLSFTAFPSFFFSIDTGDWVLKQYDVSSLNLSIADLRLNYNNGKLAFSDYPVMFDEYSYEEFMDSGREVTFKVYDLDTEEQEEIATSITKEFEPEWIEDNLLEYNDPDSSGRLQVVVE
jgi:hypothetical protein